MDFNEFKTRVQNVFPNFELDENSLRLAFATAVVLRQFEQEENDRIIAKMRKQIIN